MVEVCRGSEDGGWVREEGSETQWMKKWWRGSLDSLGSRVGVGKMVMPFIVSLFLTWGAIVPRAQNRG